MQRNISFDFLRILACLMVVVMHAQPASEQESSLLLVVSSYATAPCIGLFFMLSGALRLSRPIANYRSYFQRILQRIVVPVIFWNTLYGVGNAFVQQLSWLDWHTYRFLFRLNNPTLWFIFPLLGMYLLTPILQSWLQSSTAKQQRGYLLLWAVTLVLPWFKSWLPIDGSVSSMYYYFSGYVGYYLLGYHLHRFHPRLSWTTCLAFIVAWLVPIAIKLAQFTINFYETFWYLSIFVVAQCVFWMQTAASSKMTARLSRYQSGLTKCSQLTFGVYLVHWAFVQVCRRYTPVFEGESPFFVLYLGVASCSILGSFVFAWLLHRSKWTRPLIGG